jgi:DNA polymerase III gamma/tau subunit
LIQELLTAGASLTEFCLQVVEYLRGVMVLQMTGDVGLLSDLPSNSVQRMQEQASQLPNPTTLFAIKRFSEAIPELKGGYQPQLPLELALIESIQGPTTRIPADIDAPVQPLRQRHGSPRSQAKHSHLPTSRGRQAPCWRTKQSSPKRYLPGY